jgi:sucrose phosphorylase
VVIALCAVIRWRNRHPAFQGEFTCGGGPDGRLWLQWTSGASRARLEADTIAVAWTLTWTTDEGVRSSSTLTDPPAG